MRTYSVFDLRKDVDFYGIADGSFRGIMQTPVMLGIAIALMHTGETHQVALGEIFLYVIGLPRFISLITELLGGVISIKLGRIGSFKVLMPGYLLRGLSILSYLYACLSHDRFLILASGFCATILSEFGRGIISGSVQDAYEQMATFLLPEKKEHLIAELNNNNNHYIFIARMAVTVLGVLGLIFSQILNNNIILILVFSLAALPQFLVMIKSYRYYMIAKEKIGNSNKYIDVGDMKNQLFVFFKNGDWMLGIGFGFYLYNMAYCITFSTLTFSNTLPSIADGSIRYENIVLMTVLALNSAFSAIVATSSLRRFFNIKAFNEMLYSSWGIFLMFFVGFLSCLFIYYKPYTEIKTIIFVFALNFIWTPLLLWGFWLRRKVIESVQSQKDYAKFLGQTNVFYYSLVTGMYETGLAIGTSLFYFAKYLHLESIYSFFTYLVGSILIGFWYFTRNNREIIFTESILKGEKV